MCGIKPDAWMYHIIPIKGASPNKGAPYGLRKVQTDKNAEIRMDFNTKGTLFPSGSFQWDMIIDREAGEIKLHLNIEFI